MTLQERLRDATKRIRTTPVPIKDLIPLLQECADRLDAMQEEIDMYDAEHYNNQISGGCDD